MLHRTAQSVLEGRLSFPSGHTSTAFSGMVFLSLWIAGQTGAWRFTTSQVPGSIRSSRTVIFSLTLLPIFWAMHVGITRIQDHVSAILRFLPQCLNSVQRHHKEDVIVGSFIGTASALIAYLMFWPSPFSSSSFEFGARGQPRLLYIQDRNLPSRAEDFELTQTGSEGDV
jgi:membrane-associated phospholipid phosphatase